MKTTLLVPLLMLAVTPGYGQTIGHWTFDRSDAAVIQGPAVGVPRRGTFTNPQQPQPVLRMSSTRGDPGSNRATNGSSISLYIEAWPSIPAGAIRASRPWSTTRTT